VVLAAELWFDVLGPWRVSPAWAILGSLVVIALTVLILRHESAWIELDGDILRAKRLVTRRVVSRRIGEVQSLFTDVRWFGYVDGVEVRFKDGAMPIKIRHNDYAMRNAQELIGAIVYRMTEIGEVEFCIAMIKGEPLVREVCWAEEDQEIEPLLREAWAAVQPRPGTLPHLPTAISPPETPPPDRPPTVQSQPPPPPRSS
jgi:hypothetical protein